MFGGDQLHRSWLFLAIAGVVAIFIGAGVYIFETMPPRDVVMATGAVGGANYELGIRYREILSQSGVKLQLLPTTGGLENLARLRKAGVDVGFIQGGTTAVDDAADVESLGTIFYEPLWFFYRSEIGQDIQALRGRRVSIGPEGSGTRALALTLIQRFKLDSLIGALSGFEPQVSAEKLVAGEIDAAFIVTGWDSPVVQRLMNAKGIEIAGFPHADAYVALYPFLNKLVLPASVSDLLNNRPPKDVVLLAPKASLAVRAGPSSIFCLMLLFRFIHSPEFFRKLGNFLPPRRPISRSVTRHSAFTKTGARSFKIIFRSGSQPWSNG
jgi:TRAP transporter TAXI family solute receptor